MKKTIISILVMFSLTSMIHAQGNVKKDTTARKDSVYVPVYIYDQLDTVRVEVMLYEDEKGFARVTRPGYIIYSGKATLGKDGKMQWLEQPKAIGAFDSRKRKVKNL